MEPCYSPDELLALVSGADDDAAIHDHLDRCDACRAALAAATRARLEPGGDRYVVIDVLGAGATGVVYAAYDRKLDRRVALKLVRRGTPAWSERFALEAKALARLSHPNVVVVYDVGARGDQLFIAMELVDGMPLAAWLAQRRPWRDVLAMFEQAAHGLAAAHDAGIVHRDFKPDNVVIGRDGRARVADFGLARVAEAPSGARGSPPLAGSAAVGTPIYAAPEQLAGEPIDARADQFSFCVALYEALFGAVPFGGATLADRAAAVAAREIRPPAPGVAAPAWLRARVVRGLAPDPAERYPSMRALIDALRADPTIARRRRWLAAAGLAATAGAVALGPFGRAAAPPCSGTARELAGAWDGEARRAIAHAFAASGAPFAAELDREVEGGLDRYATRWIGARRDACEATRVRGEQSEELLDLRMACLDARRDELRELAGELAGGDPAALRRAASAVDKLARVEDCNDASALRAELAPPRDPVARFALAGIRAELADARALDALGLVREAEPIASRAADDARRLGDRAAQAEAGVVVGRLAAERGELAAAEAALLDAVVAAEAAHHDRALVQAMGALTFVVGYALGRYAEGDAWQRQALAIVDRLGDDVLAGRVLNNAGSMQYRAGRYELAIASHREALRRLERALGPDDLELANVLNNLGAPLDAEGRYDEALAQFRRALAIYQAREGASHPDVASELDNIGAALRDLGRLDEAIASLERALAIAERAEGRDAPPVASVLENLANALRDRGDTDRALALLDRALAIRTATAGPIDIANVERDRADVLAAAGRDRAALDAYRRALDQLRRVLPADHPKVVELELNRSIVERRSGQAAAARSELAAVVALAAPKPELARYLPYALERLGVLELDRHDATAAERWLDRAVAAWPASPGDPAELAETRFLAARARWETGDDRAHARAAAALARAALAAAGPRANPHVAEAAAWLATH